MQPNLTLKTGQTIPLTNEVYEAIMQIVERNKETITSADSIEELETEFSELFASTEATTDDLLAEHAKELKREKRKAEMFG